MNTKCPGNYSNADDYNFEHDFKATLWLMSHKLCDMRGLKIK